MVDEIEELGLQNFRDFAARSCELGVWVANGQRRWSGGGQPDVSTERWWSEVVVSGGLVAVVREDLGYGVRIHGCFFFFFFWECRNAPNS